MRNSEEQTKSKPTVFATYTQYFIHQGKGAGIHSDIFKVTGNYRLAQEGTDLEHDPVEYIKLLKPTMPGSANEEASSGFISGSTPRIRFSWHSNQT